MPAPQDHNSPAKIPDSIGNAVDAVKRGGTVSPELFSELWRVVVSRARQRLSQRPDLNRLVGASDLASETLAAFFLAIEQAIDPLTGEDRLPNLRDRTETFRMLIRLLRNKVSDILKHHAAKKRRDIGPDRIRGNSAFSSDDEGEACEISEAAAIPLTFESLDTDGRVNCAEEVSEELIKIAEECFRQLTDEERRIMVWAASGVTNNEIARRLGIGKRMVEYRRATIRQKIPRST